MIRIEKISPTEPDVRELLAQHLSDAASQSASHAYHAKRLSAPDMHFFTARDVGGRLMGFGAIKILSSDHGEIKSVRTHPDFLRRGVSEKLMEHVITYARNLGLARLSLETHPTPQYVAARALYEKLGFSYCPPFEGYENEPDSVFMTREL